MKPGGGRGWEADFHTCKYRHYSELLFTEDAKNIIVVRYKLCAGSKMLSSEENLSSGSLRRLLWQYVEDKIK